MSRRGLEAVLRPPVRHPTALVWVPGREELLVGTRAGEVFSVDPVLGLRIVMDGLAEVAELTMHGDRKRFLAMGRDGSWVKGTFGGQVQARGEHPFRAGLASFFAGEHAVMMGEDASGKRSVRIFRGDRCVANLRLPRGAIAAQEADGSVVFCRSGAAGLEVLPLEDVKLGAHFGAFTGTDHRLRARGRFVFGLTNTGFALLCLDGGPPLSLRLGGVSAGSVSADGTRIGLGTDAGGVALARTADLASRNRPDLVRAYNEPVRAAAFSDVGRWYATAAESLRLWTWSDFEDGDGDEPPESMPVLA